MTQLEPTIMNEPITQAEPAADKQWQALSPWSIISFVIGTLKNIVTNGYAVIPIVYAGWQNNVSVVWIIDGTLLLIVLLTIFGIIQWRKFRYYISDTQLEVRRGLFFTKKDEIPLNRIQNIRYEQPFYFKPLKLAVLVIETAGSSKDEAKLTALDALHAHQLKNRLLQLHQDVSASTSNDEQPNQVEIKQALPNQAHEQAGNVTQATSSQPIVKRNLKDLILFGFYQNNFIWFAIIAGPVAGQIEWEQVVKSPLIQQIISWASQLTHNSLMLQVALFIGLLVVSYVLFSVISIVASVLKYHPYSLDRLQQTLHRSGGVISHQQDALAIKRIQILHFQQPLLARIFQRWTVYLKQVKGNEVEQRTKQHMLLPSIRTAEIDSIFAQLPTLSRDSISLPNHYQPINIAWFYKRVWVPFTPLILLTALQFITDVDIKLLELAAVFALVISALLFLRYKRWGYVVEDNAVWQHSGLFSRNWKRIPFDKIQHVKITQTASQKKQHLAYLELGLASGKITLPYIPVDVASKLIANSLNKVAKRYSQWI